MTTQPLDWTRGYREAWIALRGAVAWTFIGWTVRAFHPADPDRHAFVTALVPLAKAAVARRNP